MRTPESAPLPDAVVFIAASVDGYIARLDGSLDWLPEADPEEDYGYATFMATVDALVMGRKTYEVVRGFGGDWPYAGTPVVVLSHGQPILPEGAEVALLGVRRAQSILGAFFLERDADVLAEQIRFDMREEPASRMRKIRDDILAVEERKFWEVTDRGFNFDWVSPDLRPRVVEFFEPMLKLAEQRASSVAV